MTKEQICALPIHLLRHALGVQAVDGRGRYLRWRRPYRNYFVTSRDDVELCKLESAGLVTCSKPVEWLGENAVWRVTPLGIELATEGIVYRKRWGYGVVEYGESY